MRPRRSGRSSAIGPEFEHYAAIDWSGAIGPRQKGIAVAICSRGTAAPGLFRCGHVWSRQEVCDWLLDGMPPCTLVGLDLGASLPFIDADAFFPGWAQSPADARELWALVERICTDEPHLAAARFVDHEQAQHHFRRHGGRKGRWFEGHGRLRETERQGAVPRAWTRSTTRTPARAVGSRATAVCARPSGSSVRRG